MSNPPVNEGLRAAERALEPLWCDPAWPRNEFGTAKQAFEMSPAELDRAVAVIAKRVA